MLLAFALLSLTTSVAAGQDLNLSLADAQAELANAQADVGQAEDALRQAEDQSRPLARMTGTATRKAEDAAAELEETRDAIVASRQQAAAEVAMSQLAYADEKESYERKVGAGLGAGLALLVLAASVYLWPRIRSSASVRRFASLPRDRAVGIVAALALVAILLGAVLIPGGGVSAAFGAFLLVLLLGLVLLLTMARRSRSAVEQGPGASGPGDEFRARLGPGLAAGLLVAAAAGLSAPIIFDAPDRPSIPGETLRLASLAEDDPTAAASEEIREAQEALDPLEKRAAGLGRRDAAAKDEVRSAHRELASAQRRVEAATNDVDSISLRIEREEERAARQAEQRAQAALDDEQAAPDSDGVCEPGYSPCVPSYPPDVDCPDVSGPVTVTGSDPHGLDADGDGAGCET